MFFKSSLNGAKFFCDLFNAGFEIAYQGGIIKKRRIFKATDFIVSDIQFTPTERMVFIELPLPILKKDWKVIYLKSYCIPYLQYEDTIKILDLYAEQGCADSPDECRIIKFIKGEEFKVCAEIKGDRQNTLGAMYKIVFENFDPYNNKKEQI